MRRLTLGAVLPVLMATGCAGAPAHDPAAPTSAIVPASAAPTGDLPGWRLVMSQDFTQPAPLGTFAGRYPGWAGYDGYRDTSRNLGRPAAEQGIYDSATTTSVHDGVLDVLLHTSGSTPQVMAVTPVLPGRTSAALTYGRFAFRFRVDPVAVYRMADLLWPADENRAEGEVDFPEGNLSGNADGYSHDVTGADPSRNTWALPTGKPMAGGWHVAVIEWIPGRLTYQLDGTSWSTSDLTAVPTSPMRWVMQLESGLTLWPPPQDARGHVLVDWMAVWTRQRAGAGATGAGPARAPGTPATTDAGRSGPPAPAAASAGSPATGPSTAG